MSTVHYRNDDEYDARQADPIDIIVGENVRRLRLIRQISQTKLGEMIGVTFQQIGKYEAGSNRICASKVVKLAAALKVDIPMLFDGTGRRGRTAALPDFLGLMDKDDIELWNCYKAIICPKQKKALLNLARTMAKAED
jgi:transcriptional regulator with XRE-family HTH domain